MKFCNLRLIVGFILGVSSLYVLTSLANTSNPSALFSPEQVINLANLTNTLSKHGERITAGAADGRAIISPYVTVLNGEELVAWLQHHNYASHSNIKAVRRYGNQCIEVEIDIFSKNKKHGLRIILYSDGYIQGAG